MPRSHPSFLGQYALSTQTDNPGRDSSAHGGSATIARFGGVALAILRAHVLLIGVIAALVLLYALAGFFLVPRVVRSQIESYAVEELHKQATVGEVHFNPFVFDASVAGLQLTETDGRPLVGFRHLYVNAQLASLWRRAIVLKEIELSAPDVRVVVAPDGTVNLASLASQEAAAPDAEASSAIGVHIDRLFVRDGRVGVEDRTHPKPFVAAMEPISFTLANFRTDAGHRNAYRFFGTTLAGEELEWSGVFTVQPLGSTGRFSVRGLKLATVDSYLYESLPFRLASGQALLGGTYAFSLDPLTLDVTMPSIAVRDLSLAERIEGARAPIRVPEIDVDELTFSYGKRTLGVKRVGVRGAQVDVARESDGTLSLARLFEQADAAATVTPITSPAPEVSTSLDKPTPSSLPWSASIGAIQLDDAALRIEDQAIKPAVHFALSPADVTIEGWSTEAGAKMQLAADVGINEKARFTAKGALQLEPLTTSLALELADFDLATLQSYLAPVAALTLHSGKLNVKGTLDLASTPGAKPTLRFAGDANVAGLRTTDQILNEDLVKWRDLAVTGIDYREGPDRLVIDRIVARAPYASVIIAPDATLNLSKVMSPADAGRTNDVSRTTDAGAEREAPDSQPLPVSIRTVQIIDGSAHFADHSIQPNFATALMALNGKITGLSSASTKRGKVQLAGKVDRYAPVDIAGEVNLLSAAKYTDLAMNFRNMELTTFNPYSGKFAGYAISKGKLTTELKYHVEDRKLLAEHHIVVDNLEFGAKTESKDAAPIPIKLAVALLKDRQGVIDVNLPVSGTLDDPTFRLGPIVWKAVLGLLTKIVTAPFAALGALFGGGDELAFVSFAPGSADLSAAEAEKLGKLAKALAERPQLRLDVPITIATAQDGAALARSALNSLAPPQADATDEAGLRKRLAQLESVYKTRLKRSPQYAPETQSKEGVDYAARVQWIEAELLQNMQPDVTQLDMLARARAQAVQGAVLANTQVDPQRVFVTTDRAAGANADAVRMELKLE